MAMDFEAIQKIKAQADIVTVISHYIPVIKKGASYVAVCPFHHDTNPSLNISPAKQIFKCFVCGTGGDVFSFVEKFEHCQYMEAVKKVCEICSLTLPEGLAREVKKTRVNEKELNAVTKLSEFYHYMLSTEEGKKAKAYLTSRGLEDPIIDHFRIGYAPVNPELSIQYLRNKEKFDVQTLDAAGIISAASSSFSDRYRDRVMFPLSDIHGDLVGFSGRRYEGQENEPKYINSPESVIFRKSELLYNFDQAVSAIRREHYVYVLEGFMDVIALYRAGIEPAVGLMGTALTNAHIALFQKLNVEIRLCLDSDEPGQQATEKALQLLDGKGLRIQVVKPLSQGKDADELLKAAGPEALRQAMLQLELPIIHSLNFEAQHSLLNTYEDKERFLRQERSYYASSSVLAKPDILRALSLGLKVSPEGIQSIYSSYQSLNYPETKAPIQESSYEDEAIAEEEVNNGLFRFIAPRLENERLKETGNKPLVRGEGQILSRMTLSKKATADFEASQDHFMVPVYGDIFEMIREYYEDLHSGVDCIQEEGYDDLVNKTEIYYAQLLDDLKGGDQETKAALEAIQLKKKVVLGVLARLRNCRYPSREVVPSEYQSLLKRHKFFLAKYDVTAVTFDATAYVGVLKRFSLLAADSLAGKEED